MVKLEIISLIAFAVLAVNSEYTDDFSHHGIHFGEPEEHHGESFQFGSEAEHGSFSEHDLGQLNQHLDFHEISGHHEENDYPKDYKFDYSVHDPHHNNFQNHQQSSEGGAVKGYYSLREADGSLREVHYTADKHSGFNAIVTKDGKVIHPQTEESNQHSELHHGFN